MRELTIGKNDAGARLDRFLGKALPLLPPQDYIQKHRTVRLFPYPEGLFLSDSTLQRWRHGSGI